MAGCPDYQKSKLYAWEHAYVRPLDASLVAFENIQHIVNHVWSEMGLSYPPRVQPFPKQVSKWAGDATRLVIRFHEGRGTSTVVILHELAHSMTMDLEGAGFQHGPGFVGVFMKLLDRFIPGASLPVLMHTANLSGVKFDITQAPTITD